LKRDLDEIKEKEKEITKRPVRGILEIKIPMAKDLKPSDTMSSSSDPFVLINYPAKKKSK
jgi:Ca2+-dependent lipid-binding protein